MSGTWPIPSTWTWVQTADIAEVVGGGTPSTSDPDNFGGGIPWVTPADLSSHSGLYISGGARTLTPAGLEGSGARWLEEGAVLFSSRAPIGYCAIAANRLTTNQGFKSFVPFAGVRPEFLLHWLRSAKSIAEGLASGTTFLELSGAKAATIPVPLAPEGEQVRICAQLNELLEGLDEAAHELSLAKRKLALYRQSLLKSAVEGSLTAEWRGEPADVDRTTSAASPEGWAEIPSSWRWSTAESECGFITKGTTPPKSLTGVGPKCVPFLRVTNLTHDGSLDFTDQVFVAEDVHRKVLARSIVKPGDVLMNIVGPPLGQVSMVPSTFPEWNVNQAIAIFRVQPGLLNEFLPYVLLSPGAGRWLQARAKTTAGQTNLTLEVCRGLPVAVPPLTEQAEIVRLLTQQLESLTEQGQAIDRALAMASAQRQNILRAAFSGQLVPQDPNDEPASVLLERIRAQRVASGDKPTTRPRQAKTTA